MTHPPDLYALIIRLTAAHGGRLRATQGHLAHAAFLDMLHQVDAPLAQALHDDRGRKPFTVSPLEGFGRGRDGRLSIEAGREGWLRLTLLDSRLFATFIRFFLEGDRRARLRLEEIEFHISEILSASGSHPLGGHDALAGLRDRWETVALAPHHNTIALQFRTPTAFSLKEKRLEEQERDESTRGDKKPRRTHVLPDPAFVFGALAERWDQLTGATTQAEVRDFAARGVVVSRYDIATHMFDYGGRRLQLGFAGYVTFEILDDSRPDLTRHLNRLADLAFYTGVGSRTTMGMGQVRRVTSNE